MSIDADLREAYQHLVDSAPGKESLLSHDPQAAAARRGNGVRVALTMATVIVVVVAASLVAARTRHGTGTNKLPGPSLPSTYPTTFWFGTKSLPGYSLSSASLSPGGQSLDYVNPRSGVPAAKTVIVSGLTLTEQDRAALSALRPVTIGDKPAFYGSLTSIPSARDAGIGVGVVWEFAPGKWAAIGPPDSPDSGSLPQAKLIGLASSVVPRTDPNVALAKVGYLPKGLRFDYAAQYINQDTMLSPDGTTGTGYRTLSFIDRSVTSDKHSTLDIVSVTDPAAKLADASAQTLPSFNNGPWTKTTVQGHLAWVAPHDVLIQWGNVQIAVASTQITGDTSTPLLSQAELLKVANSLTVPSSVAIGHGYPLADALPPGTGN